MTLGSEIRQATEFLLDSGYRKIILYPFGETGMLAQDILHRAYGRKESYLIDNYLSIYNPEIKASSVFPHIIGRKRYGILLCTRDRVLFRELYAEVRRYFHKEQIGILPSVRELAVGRLEKVIGHPPVAKEREESAQSGKRTPTIVGKYSYGPLAKDHFLVGRVGAFCSFAPGSDVVINHPTGMLSTHPFLAWDKEVNPLVESWEHYRDEKYYFPGIKPRGKIDKLSRITIGNDVWLGKNVTITNSANIGNGVIAGAGAVITKDVPDYAVVAGVPARIIRFRYDTEQVAALNRIAWWDWPDDLIRERYDDFFIDIEQFIGKYDV